jgi:hypothetical protein
MAGGSSFVLILNYQLLGVPDVRPGRANVGFLTLSFLVEFFSSGVCDTAGREAWSYGSRGHLIAERRNTNCVTNSTAYTYNFHGGVQLVHPRL